MSSGKQCVEKPVDGESTEAGSEGYIGTSCIGKLTFASICWLYRRLTTRNNLGLISYRRALHIVLRVTYPLNWLDITIGSILDPFAYSRIWHHPRPLRLKSPS